MLNAWLIAVIQFVLDVIYINVSCHIFPGPMAPGSSTLIIATVLTTIFSVGTLTFLIIYKVDPYPFGIIYSGALMLLCVEVWYREDPELFNGSRLKGYPFFLFRQPGSTGTKAPVPMAGYTRVFGAWHAGGVCLCFFMHIIAYDFPYEQKAQVSLALGLLWLIWGTINLWRTIYGEAQFCQTGIMVHSLIGPGCGLCGYLHLWFWYSIRFVTGQAQNLTVSEYILLGTVAFYFLCAMVWLVTQERKEAIPDKKTDLDLELTNGPDKFEED
jgi:hypothetical protein